MPRKRNGFVPLSDIAGGVELPGDRHRRDAGGRAPASLYTHEAAGAFARTTVTVAWGTSNAYFTLPASTR